MSHWKSFGPAIFAAVCLLGGTAGSVHAQCSNFSGSGACATEWSGRNVINLGGLPGSYESVANGINDAGQVVGWSLVGGLHATEWSGGSGIDLGGLPGFTHSLALGINDSGQVVGYSIVGDVFVWHATEWSGGSVIDLGGLPGSTGSIAYGINDSGHAVGGQPRRRRRYRHRVERRQRDRFGRPARLHA
jgi:probable HAF family extracellular repeat protein